MRLPYPKKAILYLRDKFATKKNFYVSDFDKKCMDSLVGFYNVTENDMKIDQSLFYKMVYVMVRYEIINERLNQQLNNTTNTLSIKQIFGRVDDLITDKDLHKEITKLLLECQSQKTSNFLNSKQELTKDNIKKIHFSDEDSDKALELINDFIFSIILKENDR